MRNSIVLAVVILTLVWVPAVVLAATDANDANKGVVQKQAPEAVSPITRLA